MHLHLLVADKFLHGLNAFICDEPSSMTSLFISFFISLGCYLFTAVHCSFINVIHEHFGRW